MKRTATAHWNGNLTEGKGELSTQSGILKGTSYSFKTRFNEGESGTNPEELLAAAHAACFTMSVCAQLSKRTSEKISLEGESAVELEDKKITGIRLSISGSAKGISEEEFILIAKDAGKNCILSKALSVPISTEAKLTVMAD